MKKLRTNKQVEGYLQGNDWERCDVIGPLAVYLHADLCPIWVDRATALSISFQQEIGRLEAENEKLREKLKRAKK